MRHYELMLAISGDLIESEQQQSYQEVIDLLGSLKAEITYEESWGKMPIAYRIAGQNEAYYSVIRCTLDPSQTKELEKELNIKRFVIRYLLSHVENTTLPVYTKADYDKGVEAYYQSKQERKKYALPKTRATTAVQLKEEMDRIKDKSTEQSNATLSTLDKDLSA